MPKVVRVNVLRSEFQTEPMVEVAFSYLNAVYAFLVQKPKAEPGLISARKPGSRDAAPRLPRKIKASMFATTAAIARGHYQKLGLLEIPAKPTKPENLPLFPRNDQSKETRPGRQRSRRQILRYPTIQQPLFV